MLISLIGGRIVPAFTRNWLMVRGADALPAAFARVDRAALATSLLALLSWIAEPHGEVTGYLLLVAGLAQAVRLSRWRGLETRAEPLMWILHVGYAFVPVGMLALGTANLWPDVLMASVAEHLWMAGAIGVMTIAVMTRATLGHTGRPLTAGAGTTGLFVLVLASVLARLLAGVWPELAVWLLTLSAALWSAGFAGFAALYGPSLLAPRS